MEQPLLMEYTVALVEGRGLELSYTVRNASSRSVFLTTPLVEVDDASVVDVPDKLYAYLDPDGILQLTKRVWPVPDDVDIYFPEVPRLTELSPGAKFQEKLVCALPVEVGYPYRFAGEEDEEKEAAGGPVSAEAYGVAFSIGYVVAAEGAAPGEGGGERVEMGYGMLMSSQRLLQGAAVPVRVIVTGPTDKVW